MNYLTRRTTCSGTTTSLAAAGAFGSANSIIEGGASRPRAVGANRFGLCPETGYNPKRLASAAHRALTVFPR